MEKKYFITRREFNNLTLMGGLASILSACGGGGGGAGSHKNQLPSISIFPTFKNEGAVDYTIIGTDTDGQVVQLQTKYNDEDIELNQSDNITLTKPINKQANTLEVRATDNEGGISTFSHTLSVPIRETAYNQIKQMLDSKGGFLSYESDPAKKISFYLDNTEHLVDFFITRADGRFSVINYVDFNENTEAQQFNQRTLESYFIDNLFLYKLPKDEITKKLDEFIKAGYLTDFR